MDYFWFTEISLYLNAKFLDDERIFRQVFQINNANISISTIIKTINSIINSVKHKKQL